MLKLFTFLSTAIVLVVGVTFEADFSKYRNIETCEGRPHTFWVYRKLDAAPSCDKVIKNGLTAIEKKKILDSHNKYRQKVMKGEETRGNPGPQPAAKAMPELEWDDELAELAQRWVQQCNLENDQCRDVERFAVNQLIIMHESAGDISEFDVNNLVKLWYDEVEKFDPSSVNGYSDSLKGVSNSYTQIVWANTTYIGCGGIRFPIPNLNRFHLVCNYGPGGNIIGKEVYRTC